MATRVEEQQEFVKLFNEQVNAPRSSNEPTNEDRAEWARLGLLAFAVRTGQSEQANTLDSDDCFYEVVGDFIGDMAHLARMYGKDLSQAIERGMFHFNAEVSEETK